MLAKKYLLPIIFVGFLASVSVVRADDISDLKALLSDTVAKLVQKYEARIQELETENKTLKQELASIRGTGTVISTIPLSPPPKVLTGSTLSITSTTPKTDIYNAVIDQTNARIGAILSENNLPAYTAIGLFEFIEPNAFFISLDDGNNPPGVTAFRAKVLYTFDNTLTFTKIGLFELDYTVQKYRTMFGSNPYVKSVRTRIANPKYKGKLLDPIVTTNAGNVATTGNTTTTPSTVASTISTGNSEVTLAQIKSAYDKNKTLDALKLSDTYMLKDPSNLEVLRIRYRSYYIIGKYEESLAEIKKMEALQGTAFERTIACDAAVIGKIAKKTDISTYYGAICKKK